MFSYIKSHSVLMGFVVIVIVAGAMIASRAAKQGSGADTSANIKSVTLVPASSFRADSSVINGNGTVESAEQVDLKSQISAPVTSINVAIGDWVTTGQALINLQNADITAQLKQAQANLALAQAQYSNAGISLDSAKKSAVNAVIDAYRKSDDAVHTQADPLFSNPSSPFPTLDFTTTDSQLVVDIQNERVNLESELSAWKSLLPTLDPSMNDSALDAALSKAQTDVSDIAAFLDKLSSALNGANPNSSVSSSIAGWKITITTTRATISAVISALTSAQQGLVSARATLSNPNGASSTGQAAIQAAQAAVTGLEAQLAKTVITAPFSGKVSAMTVKLGDLVSPGETIVSVTNDRALEVKAYVSDTDVSRISVGSKATIGKGASAVLTNISPSIDPTNKKVEIKLVVTSVGASGLVIGQNVPVMIGASQTAMKSSAPYLVPIQDIKIVQGASYVYTVNASSTIVRSDVSLGAIRGDFVEVKSGLSDDMSIVSPVYELEEGQKVSTQ